MAAPYPARRSRAVELWQRKRLRIMDDDDVVLLIETLSVLRRVLEVGLLLSGGERPLCALQCVVHRLGDREELVVAADELPVCDEAKVSEQRYRRPQDLGHAAAVRGRVNVQHLGAAQR
jgi:hypothetical protein